MRELLGVTVLKGNSPQQMKARLFAEGGTTSGKNKKSLPHITASLHV